MVTGERGGGSTASTPPTAGRPAILTVDDDPQVLDAVADDLRRRYAGDYRIVRAESGPTALDALRELARRGAPVALLLVDQRMPAMTGVELLAESLALHPGAKRVLLTAYADTEAAIAAINEVDLDHYVLKPWHPPEERLYPVLDDLLADWQSHRPAATGGIRVIGARWEPASHGVRRFLARHQVPFEWLDVERGEGRRLARAAPGGGLPLVVLEDGSVLAAPGTDELAEALGIRTRSATEFFDLVVVGAGPAGLAAAVYGASEGLTTTLLDRDAPGGQAGTSSRIENYLGFPRGLSGADLARRALAQARRFGAEVVAPAEVCRLDRQDPFRTVHLRDGSVLTAGAVILATGVDYRRLSAAGAEQLTGAGVYYGASPADAAVCTGLDVVVVGGANSAGQAALHLAGEAASVTMLVRSDRLEARMSAYLVERIRAQPNIRVRLGASVESLTGDGHLERAVVRSVDGTSEDLACAALFAFIGAEPHTEWLAGKVERDDRGFVVTGPDTVERGRWGLERDPFLLETSLPGVFAAGDVRSGSTKRVAAAVGEGSTAVQLVHAYLQL